MVFPEKSISGEHGQPRFTGEKGENAMRIESEKYGGSCACGRDHAMATRLCVIEAGAAENLVRYLAEVGLAGLCRCAV